MGVSSLLLRCSRRQSVTSKVLALDSSMAVRGGSVSRKEIRGNPNPSGCGPVWKQGLCRYSSSN